MIAISQVPEAADDAAALRCWLLSTISLCGPSHIGAITGQSRRAVVAALTTIDRRLPTEPNLRHAIWLLGRAIIEIRALETARYRHPVVLTVGDDLIPTLEANA